MTASNKAFGKRRRILLGSLAALFSAIAFSMNVTLAGLAYQHGANIHALNITRAVLFWLVLFAVVRVNGVALNIPNKVKLACVLLGVLLGVEMYVLLGAIVFIPVALAIVTMYTYPLMIGIYDWISKRDRFSYLQLALMFFVFAGLFLALSGPTGMVNTTGVLLAFAAAVFLALLLILSERTMSEHENIVVMLYILTGTCASIILFLIFVELQWPTTSIGWLTFSGSSGCYVVATFLLFTAVDMVGPLRTAIIDNTSPVWAVLFGFLLLGQALSLTQILGVVMVVSGVFSIQWVKRERI